MDNHRFTMAVFTSLIIRKAHQILLLKRNKHKICGGYYAFPGGGVDGQETMRQATVREAFEEVGISIHQSDLKFVHVYHFYRQGDVEYVNFFFEVQDWQGTVENKEPDKCDELLWVDIDSIPHAMLPGHRHVLQMIQQNISYSEFGWENKNIQPCNKKTSIE